MAEDGAAGNAALAAAGRGAFDGFVCGSEDELVAANFFDQGV
jgi:hypothetical protein